MCLYRGIFCGSFSCKLEAIITLNCEQTEICFYCFQPDGILLFMKDGIFMTAIFRKTEIQTLEMGPMWFEAVFLPVCTSPRN